MPPSATMRHWSIILDKYLNDLQGVHGIKPTTPRQHNRGTHTHGQQPHTQHRSTHTDQQTRHQQPQARPTPLLTMVWCSTVRFDHQQNERNGTNGLKWICRQRIHPQKKQLRVKLHLPQQQQQTCPSGLRIGLLLPRYDYNEQQIVLKAHAWHSMIFLAPTVVTTRRAGLAVMDVGPCWCSIKARQWPTAMQLPWHNNWVIEQLQFQWGLIWNMTWVCS